MASVTVDPALPLEVLVDLQSRHRAAFRLFRRRAGHDPEILKEGIADAAAFLESVAPGDALIYEFIYFAEPFDFRAVLVFRQDGQLREGGVLAVVERGDGMFTSGEVAFR